MIRRFSKGQGAAPTHAVLYTDKSGGMYIIKKCASPSEAFDFIFNYDGTLDKTSMSIYANSDVPSGVVEMSEQDFLATVRHPVQKHFSKKSAVIIKKHRTVY